jgi:hypothetical protein
MVTQPGTALKPALIGSFGSVGLVSVLADPGIEKLSDRLGPDLPVAASLAFRVLGGQVNSVAKQVRISAINPDASSRRGSLLQGDRGLLELAGRGGGPASSP